MGRTRETVRAAAFRVIRELAPIAGAQVVRADSYSPLIDPAALPASVWERPAPMPGVELDLDGQLDFLARLRPWIDEFAASHPPSGGGFALENPMYGPMDSHVLYAVVRQLRPGRVVELGSGYSSLVIAAALGRNALDGDRGSYEVIDPQPSPLLRALTPQPRIRRESAASVDDEVFAELGARDLLFVDTSHTVKPGGEVVRLVLEVVPQLADGVVIHFHDVFRPFEYPRALYEQFGVHWQEQYLVQAMLSGNAGFRVLCANHALARLRREPVREIFASLRDGMEPSGFWIVRQAAGSTANHDSESCARGAG